MSEIIVSLILHSVSMLVYQNQYVIGNASNYKFSGKMCFSPIIGMKAKIMGGSYYQSVVTKVLLTLSGVHHKQ